MIETKQAHFEASPPPRLIILAGSNARVSHSAKTMESILGIPVTNGGLSADTSIALTIEVFEPLLKTGDFVYLPLEYHSYLVDDRASKVDYLYLYSYNRSALLGLQPRSMLQASFSFDLAYLGSALGEMFLHSTNLVRAQRGNINAYGDQFGHDKDAAEAHRNRILELEPFSVPDPAQIAARPETIRFLEAFLSRCHANGITVIGGLPTTFSDNQIGPELVESIQMIYLNQNHHFLQLSNKSQYPRASFYDSQYHLIDEVAREHSRELAYALKQFLR